MFVDDNRTEVEVSLRNLEDLVKYTQKRVEKAKKVLENPSDDNLREYNHVVEIQDSIRRRVGIYPTLTEEEKAASTIWMNRKNTIEWL